mgnify:CR=1 FL=1
MSNEMQDQDDFRTENGAAHKTIIIIYTHQNNICEK